MNNFQIFSNCKIVKGFNTSIIYDLQRQKYELIPNDLYEIIIQLNQKVTIDKLLIDYGIENKSTINDYLEHLISEEYGFYCTLNDFDLFPLLDEKFKSPLSITNCVLEYAKSNIKNLYKYLKQIECIGLKDISILFYEELEQIDFIKILDVFEDSRIKSIEITTKFSDAITEDFFKNINKKPNRLTRLIFYSSAKNEVNFWDNDLQFDRIYTTKEINSFIHCGIVSTDYFNTNLPKVLEAINHNSCLHKKIAIDIDGNIKNCPSMPQSFGNIKDTTLEEALAHKDFKKYWNINKDQIEVCKDCEFRYICTDCRAYTERTHTNTEGLDVSKPLKCGYSPYTGEWEEWSTNPLKDKAIQYYGMQDLVKKDSDK